jgi:ribosomal protein L29
MVATNPHTTIIQQKAQSFKQRLRLMTHIELQDCQITLYAELARAYAVQGLRKLQNTSLLRVMRRKIAITHTILGERQDDA